jgi:hypothetical protein
MPRTQSKPIEGSTRAQRIAREQFAHVMNTKAPEKRDLPEIKVTMWSVLRSAYGETFRLTRMAVRGSKRAKLVLRVLTLATIVLTPLPISATLLGVWMAWEPYCLWRKWEAWRQHRATSPEKSKRKGLTIRIEWN